MDNDNQMTVTFRCLPELEAILPRPKPAVQGLPDWFKSMPQTAFNPIANNQRETVKRCPPFVDAMAYGFLIPLICDLAVKDGEFSWDLDLPAKGSASFVRSPIGFHDPSQVTGTPLFDEDQFVLKFHNLWTIETPPGYSLLFTHPVNRFDLPFTTLTGLVDTDRYHDGWVHFPAYWHDPGFSGLLPKGTPVAQCLPVRRETWVGRSGTLSDEETQRMEKLSTAVSLEAGIYRRQFRVRKR